MSVDFDIALFIAVVDHDGFQRAADVFDIPRSTVSKRIARLESRLGVRLLNRNSRSLSLTPAGRIYYNYGKQALTTLNEAEQAVRAMREEPSGILRVTCAVMIGVNAVVPRLPDFYRACPKVRIELSLSDRFEDIVAGGFDIGIRLGVLADSSLIARRIMSARRIICASPAYIERHGRPEVPDDLFSHNCLNLLTLGRSSNEWSFGHSHGIEKMSVSGSFTTDNGAAHYAAVLSGLGVGRITHLRALRDLEEGRLVRLLESFECVEASSIYAVMPSNRNLIPAVRAFVDFLAQTDP